MKNKGIIKQEIYFLEDLLMLINQGKLRIPNFQRPYVWNDEDMLSLFDSILNEYPIGSLFFWETEKKFKTLDKFGNIKIPTTKADTIIYILDGQQRLVTLYSALRHNHDNMNEFNWRDWIYFDLEKKDFLHIYKQNKLSHYFPLRAMEKTTDFLKECRRIEENVRNSDTKVEDAEKLLKSFKDYKVSVTKFIGGNLEDAVEIFSRLNRHGKKITTLQLFEALTYSEGEIDFDLSYELNNLIDRLAEYNYEGINRYSLFRILIFALNKSYITKGWYKLAKLHQSELPVIMKEITDPVIKTVIFLKNELLIPNFEFIPYINQFTFLVEFFRSNKKVLTTKKKQALKKWFWVGAYTGWFTYNKAKYNELLIELRKYAEGDIEKLSVIDNEESALPFPKTFIKNSGRVKTFILFLSYLKPKDLDTGKDLDVSQILIEYKGNSVSKVITKSYDSPANYIFLGPISQKSIISKLKKIIEDKKPNKKKILDSHCLTEDMIRLLISGKHEDFIKQRERKLFAREIEFMKKNHVIPPASESAKVEVLPEEDEEL